MSKNYNSEKIFVKNICIIFIFLFLMFLAKYSFSLSVQGLSQGASYFYCSVSPGTNDCVLSFNNSNPVNVYDTIYIDSDGTEELNLVIENNDVNFIIENNLDFGNDNITFNSLIIRNSTVYFIKEEDTINVNSNINNVMLFNSDLYFINVGEYDVRDKIVFESVEEATNNTQILDAPYIDFKETNLFIDTDSKFSTNFNISFYFNRDFSCNLGNNSVCSLLNHGFDCENIVCYTNLPESYYPEDYTGNMILYKKMINCEVSVVGYPGSCRFSSEGNKYYLDLDLDNTKQIIFKNVDNNGVLRIIAKSFQFYMQDNLKEEFSTPIIFLNYSGDKLPTRLDLDSKNIAFLKTCEDYSNHSFGSSYVFPTGIFRYDLCSFFVSSPTRINLNSVLPASRIKRNTIACDNIYISPELQGQSSFYIPEKKTINPYLFGQIYDSNNYYINDFSIKRIQEIPSINLDISLNELHVNNNFILHKLDDLPEISVLYPYSIYSKFNYNGSDINLHYGFSFFKN